MPSRSEGPLYVEKGYQPATGKQTFALTLRPRSRTPASGRFIAGDQLRYARDGDAESADDGFVQHRASVRLQIHPLLHRHAGLTLQGIAQVEKVAVGLGAYRAGGVGEDGDVAVLVEAADDPGPGPRAAVDGDRLVKAEDAVGGRSAGAVDGEVALGAPALVSITPQEWAWPAKKLSGRKIGAVPAKAAGPARRSQLAAAMASATTACGRMSLASPFITMAA